MLERAAGVSGAGVLESGAGVLESTAGVLARAAATFEAEAAGGVAVFLMPLLSARKVARVGCYQ